MRLALDKRVPDPYVIRADQRYPGLTDAWSANKRLIIIGDDKVYKLFYGRLGILL